jgi:hypothetical protein
LDTVRRKRRAAVHSLLLRVDAKRLLRDPKMWMFLVSIFGIPFFAASAGLSAAKTEMLGALFLPVIVGWSWGRDLSSGRLVPIALAGAGPHGLLFVRLVTIGAVTAIGVSAVAVLGRTSMDETLLMALFTSHILLLGFALVTLSRSGDVGWLPVFVAFAGVWLPILFTMKRLGAMADPPAVVRWLASALLPQVSMDLQLASTKRLTILFGVLGPLWFVVTLLALRRDSVLEAGSNG